MQIVQVGKEYYPLEFPQEIKAGVLTYFKKGEGRKKTKKYRVLEDVMPDRWAPLTWWDIVQIHEKYGIHCSSLHAGCKVAGIFAGIHVLVRSRLFAKARHLIKPVDADFLEMLPVDTLLGEVNVIALDKKLSDADPEYEHIECTYRGKTCSLARYVLVKYGARRKLILDALLR